MKDQVTMQIVIVFLIVVVAIMTMGMIAGGEEATEECYEKGWKAGASNLAEQLVDNGLLHWKDPNFKLPEYFNRVDKELE